MKTGIAASIKRLTAPEHRVAEKTVEAFDPFASRAQYVAYLCKLHAFYSSIEPPLFEWLRENTRRKLPLIEADLRAFDVVARSAPVAIPYLRTLGHALGVGYVLEGKTLGSRFLLAEARTKLGLEVGTSFLAGYGAETGAMWRAYLDRLTMHVAEHGERATILSGARATFGTFTRWIAITSPVSGSS